MDKESGSNYYELGSEDVTEIAVKETIDGDQYSYPCAAVHITSYGVYMASQAAQPDKASTRVIFLPMRAVDMVVINYAEQVDEPEDES